MNIEKASSQKVTSTPVATPPATMRIVYRPASIITSTIGARFRRSE